MVSGELSVEKALKSKEVLLVIVAEDASDNTKEKFEKKAFFYNIPVTICLNKEILGHSIGKDYRSVLGICDGNFANRIKELIDEQ